jgi:hypothetical protein
MSNPPCRPSKATSCCLLRYSPIQHPQQHLPDATLSSAAQHSAATRHAPAPPHRLTSLLAPPHLQVSRGKLQLAGVTSMWVAAKYEEIYAPNAGQFCYITDNTYSKEQLVTMEEQLLAALDFRLTAPTVKTFLRRWLQACVADERLHYLASYIAELSLLDHRMLQYMPAVVAAAAVYLARTMLRSKSWNTTLQHYTQLTPVELQVRGMGGSAADVVCREGLWPGPLPHVCILEVTHRRMLRV